MSKEANQVREMEEKAKKPGLIENVGKMCGLDAVQFKNVLFQVIIKPDKNGVIPSNEQVMAFLAVAQEYKLNPVTKEIFAYPAKGGGIQPVVSVDGWAKLVREHPDSNGFTFTSEDDDKGDIKSITCIQHAKNKAYPLEVTEYYSECKRNTDPWRDMPRRMLRHKALIQSARYAFGFSGIMDEDEARDSAGELKDVSPKKQNTDLLDAINKNAIASEQKTDALSQIVRGEQPDLLNKEQ